MYAKPLQTFQVTFPILQMRHLRQAEAGWHPVVSDTDWMDSKPVLLTPVVTRERREEGGISGGVTLCYSISGRIVNILLPNLSLQVPGPQGCPQTKRPWSLWELLKEQ